MRLKKLLFSLFAAALLILNYTGIGSAQDTRVSGFVDIIYTQIDEPNEPGAGVGNPNERQFTALGEIDFEKTMGAATVRVDVNSFFTSSVTAIEQAKFVWNAPVAQEMGLSLTGGIFNSPIGFEAQDAPDLYQTSNGQIFGLIPSNLAGLLLSAGTGPLGLDVIYANQWRGGTTEENTVGGQVTISPVEEIKLRAGVLHGTTTISNLTGNESVVDLVAEMRFIPTFLIALEYLQDRHQDAYGITLHHSHGNHGFTVRYDMVDNDVNGQDPQTITVAGILKLAENLTTVLEWKYTETDAPTVLGVDGDGNLLTLEFVATF